GICIFNMIFVFLYFVQKMTKLDMRSSKGTYFQKYPVFWWSNLTLVTLLAMSLWGHFIQKNKADKVVFKFVIDHPHLTFWVGTVIILLVAIGLSVFLYHKTKVGCENDMDE
ncbi:MAG: hypothetical protein IJY28_02740, partial [Clostridia bacterium]|nr:hypothetical protein [Clostridia bacterium]